jgi:hypothetical protein
MNPRRRVLLVISSLSFTAVIAACGAGSGSDDAAGKSAGGSTAARDSVSAAEPATGSADELQKGAVKQTTASALQRAVIATGSLQIRSKDLDEARSAAIGLATGLGGHVDNEQSRSDQKGRLEHVDLTLRVPSASFEKALDALGRLGAVQHREQSVEDVSTQVIDNDARVKAQAASVESVERLLARANTIGEVMSVESELARRQADLDSLKQQQRWLSDQTAMSTVQVGIARSAKATPRHTEHAHTGFLAGLEGGWHALGGTTVALGTVVGALLPFAAVLALVGLPTWLVLRRRRVASPAPAAEV